MTPEQRLWCYVAERCQGEFAAAGLPRPTWAQLGAVSDGTAAAVTLVHRRIVLVARTRGGPAAAAAIAERHKVPGLLLRLGALAELARGCWIQSHHVLRPGDWRISDGEISAAGPDVDGELERRRMQEHGRLVKRYAGGGAGFAPLSLVKEPRYDPGLMARLCRLVAERPRSAVELAGALELRGASAWRRVHDLVGEARASGLPIRSRYGTPGARGGQLPLLFYIARGDPA